MGSMALHAEHRQQQTLSPRLQHAVRLLQLSSLDFAQEVHDAMGKNPFLEAEDVDSDGPGAEAEPVANEQAAGAIERLDEQSLKHEDIERLGDTGGDDMPGDGDRDLWQADGLSGGRRSEGGETSVMDMIAVETSLAVHLHGQLNLLPLTARDMTLAKAIVDSLDDDGYLRIDLAELSEITALEPAASLEELNIALCRVQSLDPEGVGARDVGECLRLQLPAIEDEHERELARRIITEHLQQLAGKDVMGLSRALGCTPAEVEAVCDRIRRLDPRPGWRFGSSHVHYVIPDVIVKKVRNVWTVQLNPSIVPKVRLNQVYAELFQRHRCEKNGEMATHLQEARWTLKNVEQRFSTILSVAQAIVKRQQHFLEYGPMAMKPLGLREIADEVGLHESTVSRVTNNKYMATPLGVFELKYFFSRAMVTASGSACSGTAIRGLIQTMIEAEKPEAPLSDAEITRQLAQQGLVVARRTVTKYRQLLHIEAVERRRKHA
jgi:RNA polymerase sigma-54 factor